MTWEYLNKIIMKKKRNNEQKKTTIVYTDFADN